MNYPNQSVKESTQEDPGAYPIPFHTNRGVKLGSRMDSISPSTRYWAVTRSDAPWYNDVVEANSRYEEWLSNRPPGAYPVPFGPEAGKRLDEITDKLRQWGIHHNRSGAPWYDLFKKANERYEQYLAETRDPGDFPFPHGIYGKYAGKPIKDVPQDTVWWALRPSKRNENWYQHLYDANKRMLDDVYRFRSPGSEEIWFGKRYRGYRLDVVYGRKGFLNWCLSPEREEHGWACRLKNLVDRYEEWRLAHPERGGPRRQRKAPEIQNPVGEAIGPWDDSLGSADEFEEDSDMDSFIQSDSVEIVYDLDEDEHMNDGDDEDEEREEGGREKGSGGSDSGIELSGNLSRQRKRAHANVIMSDDSEEDLSTVSPGKLGKWYRLRVEESEEEI